MLQFLKNAAAQVRGQREAPRMRVRPARRRVRRPLTVERLEDRVVLSSVPVGPEFRVNTTTAGHQYVDRVAMDADGDSVVVWTSQEVSPEGQITDLDVYAQRYTAGGLPAGGEFRVNTSTEGGNWDADVAMETDGDFVVVWFRQFDDPLEGTTGDIYAQRYNASGELRGPEFRVHNTVSGQQSGPSVAVDGDGGFVVVWQESRSQPASSAIIGQRFDASGVPVGVEFVVVEGDMTQGRLRVAMVPNGQFVVVWGLFNGIDGDIVGRRFDQAGIAQGNSFLVNTTTVGNQVWPDVAMDGQGNFVATWESWDAGFTFTVFAQRYSADGARVGSEFRVNTATPGQQPVPAVAMSQDGVFVVVWGGVFGQRYTAAGLRAGGQFQVNSTTLGEQISPAVALDAAGRLLVVWSGNGPGDSWGVFAQRYGVQVDPPVLPGTTFVFSFLGFCGQVGEDPPSGMEALRAAIVSDPALAGAVVAAPPLGWPDLPGPICQLTPFVVRRQMAAARLQVRRFLKDHQYEERTDRVVLIGHSYGGNIAYNLAHKRARRDPVEGLVVFDPIDWEHCGLRGVGNLRQHCDQSDDAHTRPLPHGVSPSNVLNFVQRNPSTPFPFLHGYAISGARSDESLGRGPDAIWGTLDDTNHNLIDDDRSPGTDGIPGNMDDRELGTYDEVLDFLERLATT